MEELARRALLSQSTRTTRQEASWRRCSEDPTYWIDRYVVTYDPRLQDPFVRFRLFPKQVEFLRWLAERENAEEDGLAEKSRDVGFTWLCCCYALHGWLFRSGFAAGFGSRKLELVDRIGDAASIFEKMRIILRNLPDWQVPKGYKEAVHATHCRFVHPSNGSTITGEGGDNIGRGGRSSIFFVDEAAFLEHPQKIDAALSATTRCRVWVSTPNGPGNPFYHKRFSGRIPVFTFHWRDDPRKNDEWYREQVAKFDPVTVAQEIDIDYTASLEGITIPAKWVRAAVDLKLPDYKPSGPILAGLDVAEEGVDKNVLIARRGPIVFEPVSWSQMNTTQSAWRARDEAERLGATTLFYDCVGVGAGIRGTFDSSDKPLSFKASALNGGASPSDTVWKDGKTSRERFLNLRAELWWLLRARFEKAYEYVTDGIVHLAEEMISIPNHDALIADLSLPLSFKTETGKVKLEAKADMRRRGVKSPDFGDALAYAFSPSDPVSWWQDKDALDRLKARHAAPEKKPSE